MQVVVTAGACEFTYSADGLIRSNMEDVLTPMKASALYVGMKYNTPLAFYEAMGADEATLARMRKDFTERLQAPLGAALAA